MGVVERVGPGVSKFQKGQRVTAAGWPSGTWQRYIVQPESKLVSAILCGSFSAGELAQCCHLRRHPAANLYGMPMLATLRSWPRSTPELEVKF